MVHADASNFEAGISKEEMLQQVLDKAEALFFEQRNWVCNLANTASLLWHAYKSLPAPSNAVNWVGFYTLDPTKPNHLILAPFHGKVACQSFSFDKGVCGAAAKTRITQLVTDVDLFPGHIACDGDSRSEIVVPVLAVDEMAAAAGVAAAVGAAGSLTAFSETGGERTERTVAVLDLDCAVLGGFDEIDQMFLEKLAALLARSCDW